MGLLVGDALGVPYEFNAAEALPPRHELEMTPPAGFRRAHPGVPPGTWSDDGAQALCLLASLLQCGRCDPVDLGRRLLAWRDQGALTPDGQVFDVGIQTERALTRLREGVPAAEAGPAGERDNGNGSLMRAAPLALWHTGPDVELIRAARLQSRVTHGHLRSQLACALYVLWIRRFLEGADREAWTAAAAALRQHCSESEWSEVEQHLGPGPVQKGQGSGYVADSLISARWAVEQGPFEVAVREAIALGRDTDTTACIAGGAAGARDGIGAIPPRWRAALRGDAEVKPLLERLLEHRGV